LHPLEITLQAVFFSKKVVILLFFIFPYLFTFLLFPLIFLNRNFIQNFDGTFKENSDKKENQNSFNFETGKIKIKIKPKIKK
jgi:hypothetical protein